MKWKQAKNLVIIFLIIVNVTLFIINYYNDKQYHLTVQQEKNIINILGNNKISMYVNMPNKHYPMPYLRISPSEKDYNREAIASSIFDDYTVHKEKDTSIYTNGTTNLTFENGFFYVILEKPISFEDNPLEVLTKFGSPFDDFVLDKVNVEDDYIYYEYRERFNNNIIYTNKVEFAIRDKNIYKIIGYYAENDGYTDNKKEIISVDMALFTFVKEAKKLYGDKELFIEGIDVVYYQEEYFPYSNNNNTTNAIPCYRIYIKDQSIPFIIDAYTNKIINY